MQVDSHLGRNQATSGFDSRRPTGFLVKGGKMKQLREWFEFLSAVVVLLTLATVMYGVPILVLIVLIVFCLRFLGVAI